MNVRRAAGLEALDPVQNGEEPVELDEPDVEPIEMATEGMS